MCFEECPEGTFKTFISRNICLNYIPENFYLDSNSNIYKECYKTCKKCKKGGDEINNNCDLCINGFVFINDLLAIRNNCYKICEFYYYFDKIAIKFVNFIIISIKKILIIIPAPKTIHVLIIIII